MILAQKLLGLLNRVFDKDAHSFLALRVQYAGGMTWSVADEVLTITVTGGPGQSQVIDLTQYTVASLAGYIATQSGFTVSYMDPTRQGLSAIVLQDGSGDQSLSNGDHLYGYTSVLWAYMNTVARELVTAKQQIVQLPAQMVVGTSTGNWIDVLGSFYGVPRNQGESDALYQPRLIAEVIRPKSNNVALRMAIEYYTGQVAHVTDVISWGGVAPLFDGSIDFDGSHNYNVAAVAHYGLFDITCTYDPTLIDTVTLEATIRALVERLRAAGTHLRFVTFIEAIVTEHALPITTDLDDALTT